MHPPLLLFAIIFFPLKFQISPTSKTPNLSKTTPAAAVFPVSRFAKKSSQEQTLSLCRPFPPQLPRWLRCKRMLVHSSRQAESLFRSLLSVCFSTSAHQRCSSTVNNEGLWSASSVPHRRAAPADGGHHQSAPLPHDHLRAGPRDRQVALLVLPLEAEEGEEGQRRDRRDQGDPGVGRRRQGEELRRLAALQLAHRQPQHVPRVPGRLHQQRHHLVLPRHGRPSPSPRRLDSDHPRGGDRVEQVPPTAHQAVPRLEDQVPAARAHAEELPRQPLHHARSSSSSAVNEMK